MIKRVLKALTAGLTVGILLTGCGSQFPEMTDEEYNQTVQYAVSILMKYSNNGVERLSSLSSLELERQMEKEAREARKAERDAATAEAIANMPKNPEEGSEDTSTNEKKDETVIAENNDEQLDLANNSDTGEEEDNTEEPLNNGFDNSDSNNESKDDLDNLLEKFGDDLDQGIKNAGGTEENTEDKENEETAENPTPAKISNEPVTDEGNEELTSEADKTVEGMREEISKGIFLTYSGYSVAGSYPDNDDIFVINATSGKKLLILNFRIANTNSTDVSVDMVKANPHFQVILNGKNVGYTNVTMLDNDLSSFKGTIPAGTKKSMVLIKQMDSSKLKNVDSLGLIGDLRGEIIEFKLE
ncbi:hypothetical protein [Butyrivibrio sp. AE3004]|uniref:hypothetical protein n=1 Tax=Butyrivibrio sp. AE3004 TaxID=1506994 RepID=UPI0004945317|nr:hypothetical protein [Butyrivibrio sp. AE3004]